MLVVIMALARTLLRPAAWAAGRHASRQAKEFLAAHQRTRQVQDRLLERLLAAGGASAFGRDHGLGRVRSYADFVSAVPIGDYEARRPYLRRVYEGDAQALFAPGTEVLMFAMTSGTTGAPKHIPVTKRFLADYRRGWNIFGVRVLRDHPRGWLRQIVTIASSARESTSPTGLPCGAISGMLSETQKWIVRRMYPVRRAAAEIAEPVDRYYAVMRSAIARDVGLLTTANPSSAIKLAQTARDHAERLIRDVRDGTLSPPGGGLGELARAFRFRRDRPAARRLEDIRRRRGELLPRDFWDLTCLTMWTGGTVALYLPQVRAFYGDVPIRDVGLLASEGRMSVPLADGAPAGVAEITSNFLEFVPVEQIDRGDPDVLRADEVKPGDEYFIILTNWAGLWRYHIDDRVRVTDRLGSSPVIEFLSRGLHTSSITGEKLTEHQVVEAMRRVQRRADAPVELFTLQGHFAETPYYELRVEQRQGLDAATLADRLDEALRGMNVEYEAKRASGRLRPIRATGVRAGFFEAWEREQTAAHRGRAEQYKHKYLLTEVVNDNER